MGRNDTAIAIAVVGLLGLGFIAFIFRDKIAASLDLDFGLKPPVEPLEELEPPKGLPEAPAFPSVQKYEPIEVQRYYARRISEELDKYKEGALTRTNKLNLEAFVLEHYKSDLYKIAKLQNFEIKALEGLALTEFSRLIIKVAERKGIRLSREKREVLKSNAVNDLYGYPASDFVIQNTFMKAN